MSDPKTAIDLLNSEQSPFGSHNSQTKAPTLQGLLPRHDAICTFIIANPTLKLGEVATHFQVTQPWLSIIINSAPFQKLYHSRRDDEYDHMVLGIADKLNGLAHIVTDQLVDACAKSTDVRELAVVQKNTLAALGYGASSTSININAQQNNNSVTVQGASASALAKSREVLKQLQGNHSDVQDSNISDNSPIMLPKPESTTLASEQETPQQG